jgi:YegS/Rv2252/BmrU family lipid kinase
MKALFLVNIRSGGRRRIDVAEVLRNESRGSEHEILPCPDEKNDLDGFVARAERENFDIVYAVGGDGTVHEIAKRLIGGRMVLGILPTGSGNGLARHLGLTFDVGRAIELCRSGSVVTIDTAEVNCNPFVGVMGLGLDAMIAHRFAGSEIRGLRTYVQEGLRAFASFQPEEYEITVDGIMERRKAVLLAVANSSQYGNNARIAPVASVQDGILDVVIVETLSMLSAPLLLTRLFRGTLHKARGVIFVRGRNVTIQRSASGPAHLDGEPVTLEETLKVSVRPASLRVLLPPGTPQI